MEHSAEQGVDSAKWIAETTQVRCPEVYACMEIGLILSLRASELHHAHGRTKAQTARKRSIASYPVGTYEQLLPLQRKQ